MTSTIDHNIVCDLAKLTLLIYQYGKEFVIKDNSTIEEFNPNINNYKINEIEKELLISLSESSPNGKVFKFYNVNSTDIQVGITISELNKRISVIFRGTESWKDWYHDLLFYKNEIYDNIFIHSGFHRQLHYENTYEHIKYDILWLLKENPEYNIYITGHSLGGALATLFGYEISKEISNDINIVSFGSPRIGDYNFKNDFNNIKNLKHYRITNNNDIATAIPMINFYHVGTNIHIDDKNNDIYYNYSYYWYQYSLFKCYSIYDHNMINYYKNIIKYNWSDNDNQ